MAMTLSNKVEQASEGSRELDAEIAAAIGIPATTSYGHEALGNFYRAPAYFRHYTSSIDDALKLVPEGWRAYTADMSIAGRTRWMLVGPKTKWAVDENGDRCAGDDWYCVAVAATPALAIVAAALRAQERERDG